MKFPYLASVLLASALTLAPLAHADTLAYPSPDAASFMVDYPSSWELTPGEAVGDYLTLMSDGGTTLMLRTLPGKSEEVEQAVKDSIAYVQENYKNVKVGDPVEVKQAGQDAFVMDGNGKDSEGASVVFRMAWVALNDGTIGEIWFVGPTEDADGIGEAAAILDSLRSP